MHCVRAPIRYLISALMVSNSGTAVQPSSASIYTVQWPENLAGIFSFTLLNFLENWNSGRKFLARKLQILK